MGLSIQYELKTQISKIKDIKLYLKAWRQLASDLPFIDVGGLEPLNISCFHNNWYTSALFKEIEVPVVLKAKTGFFFNIIVGDNCEDMEVGLFKFPTKITLKKQDLLNRLWMQANKAYQREEAGFKSQLYQKLRRIYTRVDNSVKSEYVLKVKDENHYRFYGFVKTQFAANPNGGGSIPNFLQCHLSVVQLLDLIAQDIEVEVRDDGKYQQQRNLMTLLDSLGEHQELVANFGQYMCDLGIPVNCNLDQDARFSQLKNADSAQFEELINLINQYSLENALLN